MMNLSRKIVILGSSFAGVGKSTHLKRLLAYLKT